MLSQERAPIYEALKEYRAKRIVPFDVPGHKMGRGNPELTEFLGRECMTVDVNSSKPLDNLCHPVSVSKERILYSKRNDRRSAGYGACRSKAWREDNNAP